MSLSITPVSIIYIVALIYTFCRKSSKKQKYIDLFLFTVFSELFLDLGYIFKLGEYEINYSYISILVTLIYGIICYGVKIKKKNFQYILLIMVVLLVEILYRIASPSEIYSIDHNMIADELFYGKSLVKMEITTYSWISFVKVVFLLFSFIIFVTSYQLELFEKAILRYESFFKGYILFAVVELVINNVVNPNFVRNIILTLFGSGMATARLPYYRMGLHSILLTCREPSLANYALMYCCLSLYWISIEKKEKKINKYIIVAAIVMVLSLSLTGMLYSSILLLIYFVKRENREKNGKKALVLFGTILVFTITFLFSSNRIYQYMMTRLNSIVSFITYVVNNSNSSNIFNIFGGSEVFRAYSMINAIQVFLKTPLFGLGIGTANALSGWLTVLANIGLLGTVIWIMMLNSLFRQMDFCQYKEAFIILMFTFTIQGGISEVLMSGFYQIWLILITLIIQNNRRKRLL